VDHDRNSRAYGYSVRCFKNEYVVPTYTVTFNPNNGDTKPENITVTYDSQYPELPVVNKT
jgi:hypothetical protein